MPMDFREYLILIDKEEEEEEEEEIWRERPPPCVDRVVEDCLEERAASPPRGVDIPVSGRRCSRERHPEEDFENESKSLPVKFGLSDINCFDLYGQSPPPPTLSRSSSNSSPWDRFNVVTSPTKVRTQNGDWNGEDEKIFFLWEGDEDVSSPPESPDVLIEKPPHLKTKALSCPPHWPARKALDGQNRPRRQAVSFADDFGLPLTSVRFFTESSNDPPNLKSLQHRRATGWELNDSGENFLESERLYATSAPNEYGNLQPDFEQPIANFVGFMRKLDSNNVCLENVVMKDQHDVMGTIKVKNLGFEKNVTFRVSFNDWKTYCDVPATYSGALAGSSGAQSTYDTFSFRTKVQFNVESLSFAIRYKVNGAEFWDSNGGDNYSMHRVV